MAIAKVGQAKASDATGASKTSLSITYSSTTGNLLVVAVRNGNDTGTITNSVSDGVNNFFPIGWIGNNDGGSGTLSLQLFYAYNITGTANPIVVTFSAGVAYDWAYVVEFSGIATVQPFDVFNEKAEPQASVTRSAGTLTTTKANTAIIIAVSQTGFCTYTAAGAYTLLDGNIGATPGFGGVAYKIVAATQNANQTITSDSNLTGVAGVVAFADTTVVSPSTSQGNAHTLPKHAHVGMRNM